VPEANVIIGHGQMPEEELERVMFDFGQGKYDVLVCTTIIESGLDIPNVNTIIINQADRLGLAQLYQLRGRVGRSAQRAYAYLFYDRGKRLTEAAKQRLQTIFEAAELGAGFRIALRDLEIRGAGNLLGAEQSGYIHSVGFELYSKLLTEAVESVKAEHNAQPAPNLLTPPSRLQPTVDLPITALLPEEYVPDMSQRLVLYGRLARAVTTQEVDELAQELRDRFGEPPEPVRNLIFLAEVKALAFQARVQELKQEDDWLVARVWEGVNLPRTWLEQELRNLGSGGREPIGQVRVNQVRLEMPRLRNRWRNLLIEVLRRMASGPRLVQAAREQAAVR
jgi:transcription-repair coupling factor (superfamily II helicase)